MPFGSRAKTIAYPPDGETEPLWMPGSFMYFRRYKTNDDQDEINARVFNSRWVVSPEARQRAIASGRDPESEQQTELRSRASTAQIIVMGTHWEGPEFVVADDYRETPTSGIHPEAGKLAPFDEYWIGQLDPDVVKRINGFLNEYYRSQTRTPEEDRQFQGNSRPVAGSPDQAARPADGQATGGD